MATAVRRSLPDLIIIGALKSGTTSLHYYLSQHPQCVPGYAKEIHYFDGGLDPSVDTYENGVSWYKSHFPVKEDLTPEQITFEASPQYILNPLAPQRIHELLPHVRMVALLRNPTERAISQYFHGMRLGTETLPIQDAFFQEEVRLQRILEQRDFKNAAFIHHGYKLQGLYREQLERYFALFPREQMLILCSEEFFARPDRVLARVFDFAGLDPTCEPIDLKPLNVGWNRVNVVPEIYDYLNGYFRKHNEDLYDCLRQDFKWTHGRGWS